VKNRFALILMLIVSSLSLAPPAAAKLDWRACVSFFERIKPKYQVRPSWARWEAKIRPIYHNENLPTAEGEGVRYLNAVERQAYRVSVSGDGRILDSKGAPFDTSQAKTVRANEPNGHAIYVMDRDGNIFISNIQEKRRFHHSSLVAGEPVLAAGEIEIRDGRVLYIDNQSGHYFPVALHTRQFLKRLRELGADLSGVRTVDLSATRPRVRALRRPEARP
jgi:hypothetical protein